MIWIWELPAFLITAMPGWRGPDLLLCLLILSAYTDRGYGGIVTGAALGLLRDLCFGGLPGRTTLLFLLLGTGIRAAGRILNRENSITAAFLTAVGSAAFLLVRYAAEAADTLPLLLLQWAMDLATGTGLYLLTRRKERLLL